MEDPRPDGIGHGDHRGGADESVTTIAEPADPRVGRSIFDPGVRLPSFVLRETALAHDIEVMATFCRERGLSFAPHGKTTMAPAIFRRQLDAGAWAITVADTWQAEIALKAEVDRILIANEVVDDAGLDWIGATLKADPSTPTLIVLVDSVAGVERMARRLAGSSRPLSVLVDVGADGGRTGVRTVDDAVMVANAVDHAAPMLRLAGVSFYEGVVAGDTLLERQTGVRAMTNMTREIVERLAPLFERSGISEIVVSGGGSMYPDVVADEFGRPWAASHPVRPVMRSGAYVTHDHGIYERRSPFGMRAAAGAPRLEPAIEVWAPVLSVPEPGLAIAGAGRRDLPVDQDLPVVVRIRSSDGSEDLQPRRAEPGFTVTALNDQHAFIALDDQANLAVGDLVGFGISHPCTSFQVWREALLIDDADRVIDVYTLYF